MDVKRQISEKFLKETLTENIIIHVDKGKGLVISTRQENTSRCPRTVKRQISNGVTYISLFHFAQLVEF